MKDAMILMARNNAWANATLYSAIAGLSDDAFSAPRPGFFASLKQTLNHIYLVDLYYLDALQNGGAGSAVYNHSDVATVAALAALQAQADENLIGFCAALQPDDLTQQRQTERDGTAFFERVDMLLLHLFQHQIHHRGQAHTMVHDAGIAPPQLDDFYLEYGRDDAAKPYFKDRP